MKALWKRCEDAVQSPRTPCGGVCFEHAQNIHVRRGSGFAQRVRLRAVGVNSFCSVEHSELFNAQTCNYNTLIDVK